MNRKLRMGMVGGGPGAFIGDIHRKAACLDGEIEFVAGCFSRSAGKSKAMAKVLYLAPAHPSSPTPRKRSAPAPAGSPRGSPSATA